MSIHSAWLIIDCAIQVRTHAGEQGVGTIALPGTCFLFQTILGLVPEDSYWATNSL